MKTKDLYQTINSIVCRHTGIELPSLISSNKEECVDARYILVHFLSQYLTDEDISKSTGITRQSVNYIRNHFERRTHKWTVRNYMVDIGSELPVMD